MLDERSAQRNVRLVGIGRQWLGLREDAGDRSIDSPSSRVLRPVGLIQGGGTQPMQDDRFEWDDGKARSNRRKHDVSFDVAKQVFDDPQAVDEPDDYSDEERWLRTAATSVGILRVVYTERDGRFRIISARKATPHEQDRYRRQALP